MNIAHELGKLKRLEAELSGYWWDRIFSELRFLIEAIKAAGMDDKPLVDTVVFLYDTWRAEGAVGRGAVLAAEDRLKGYAAEAKSYEILCAAHAHIDMNWMWSYQETVSITLDTFRTMLTLMNEYPEFIFSQSQASVYRIVEEFDPEMLEEIKQRVKEGRWEITATDWVEADKNMISGESMVQHIVQTKRYLSALFDLPYDYFNLGFQPDTFGHNANVPEVLSQAGIRYYYHCRGFKELHYYNWRAPSGAELLVFKDPDWYLGRIDGSMAQRVPGICMDYGIKSKLSLEIYGVGDHGGGPTRFDLEKLRDMQTWPLYPRLTTGTMGSFFSRIEEFRSGFQTIDHELNYVFTGCYTSQSRIKMANRVAERKLTEATALEAMARTLTGSGYISQPLDGAWRNTLFNHFHDILPGSGVISTREHALGLFQETMARVNTESSRALQVICDAIDTSDITTTDDDRSFSEGAGVGYGIEAFLVPQAERGRGNTRIFHVFNQLPYHRKGTAELTVWDWHVDKNSISVTDAAGHTVPFQILRIQRADSKGDSTFFGHSFFTLLVAADVPGLGYSTYILSEKKEIAIPALVERHDPRINTKNEYVLENELIRAQFDSLSLELVSLTDKRTSRELIKPGAGIGLFTEDTRFMSSWVVGRFKRAEAVRDVVLLKQTSGPLRSYMQYTAKIGASDMTVMVSLDAGEVALRYSLTVQWREFGSSEAGVPSLRYSLPVNSSGKTVFCDVPFGILEREEIDDDVPALSYAAYECGDSALMLCSQTKYGFRGDDSTLGLALIRSSFDPDPIPENCEHTIPFAIIVSPGRKSEQLKSSKLYNNPMISRSNTIHPGRLAKTGELCELSGEGVGFESLHCQQGLLFRLYELDGRETECELRFSGVIRQAASCDVFGHVISELSHGRNSLRVRLGVNSLMNILIKL